MPGNTITPLIDRFWRRVQKTETCWLWTGATTNGGYGVIQLGPRYPNQLVRVHRLSWELHHERPPDTLDVLHRCDIPACVRPDHLFLGDARANGRDMAAKGRNRHVNKVRGEAHPSAKLTETAVRAIRLQRIKGLSLGALAVKHQVSKKTILNIVHGRIWAHV